MNQQDNIDHKISKYDCTTADKPIQCNAHFHIKNLGFITKRKFAVTFPFSINHKLYRKNEYLLALLYTNIRNYSKIK